MAHKNFSVKGLSKDEVLLAREKFGYNSLDFQKENAILEALKSLAKEPMVLLLLIASSIYFITGNTGDGFFMAAAIILVATISLYQDSRSRNALQELKTYSQPNSKVIRDSEILEIPSVDLVPGDFMMVEEGTLVPADGKIVQSNDFSVNESLLTGESFSVLKNIDSEDNVIYLGTTVVGGLAIAKISATGNATRLGQIGKSLENVKEEKTPLEIQISSFVQKMVIAGAIVFFIVWGINYFQSKDVLDSLLQALTLAMSILPEEIPVAFTTFMAMGAWRLSKMGIIVKQMKTVETLGGATMICADKTGTITENEMSLSKLYLPGSAKFSELNNVALNEEEKELIRLAMFASEPIPFDPMETALHETYESKFETDERQHYQMIHEYPLSGKPPMMTHLFEDEMGNRIIAAKGAAEAFLNISDLSVDDKSRIELAVEQLSREGYRVLGVGSAKFSGLDFPKEQQDFKFDFQGLLAFYDPPKANTKSVLENFYAAGIKVKMITGDNAATAAAIARQTGFKGYEKSLSGEELMQIKEEELVAKIADINVFTRMFPEAKLKIINAMKSAGEIVAMTGDGVNDGPALKASHIGIAMGKRGTEIAKQSASLILVEDDLSRMVDAVAMGRKIYTNLKKAIQYIISIHIPIILVVFLPLALGWIYPNIFSPIHVIVLELIMGPTCSIIYENEPMEKNTMVQAPRPISNTFFNWSELTTSVVQGLMITLGALLVYQYAAEYSGYSEPVTRAMVFTVLISSNIFLTLVNRSFYYSIFTTLKYKNNLVRIIILVTLSLLALMLFFDPMTQFFEFERLNLFQLAVSLACGFVFVIWFELVKLFNRIRSKTQ